MNIIKTNALLGEEYDNVNEFLDKCSFNAGIRHVDDDVIYYEDFPYFFTAYESDCIVAFMSVFIPDEDNCEVYLHIADADSQQHIYNALLSELTTTLSAYDIKNTYFLFDNNTEVPPYIKAQTAFSHSECLMQYDMSQSTTPCSRLTYTADISKESIIIDTFLEDTYISTYEVECSGNYALIHDVYVEEEYRGNGYGRETLLITLNKLKAMNFTDILLHVNSANTPAFAMYSHHGFVIKQQINYYKII